MKYILMRTVSGKTYYARTEKNNAIKKTEDIALAQRFASEKDAKKMRDRASRKLNGYKIHPVPDKSQADLRDSKIQMTDATPSVSNPPAGISSSSHRKLFHCTEAGCGIQQNRRSLCYLRRICPIYRFHCGSHHPACKRRQQ